MTTIAQRNWTPAWEIHGRYDRMQPPCEVRPWAFKPKSGRIVNLECEYRIVPDQFDAQRPKKWIPIANTTNNANKYIELTYEQAVKVAEICRAKNWPVKNGVASVIDRDKYLKSQLAALAESREVYFSERSIQNAEVQTEAQYTKATDDFFAKIEREAKPAAEKPAATPKAAEAPKV